MSDDVWIPVSEKLPNLGGYLVALNGRSVDCAIMTPLGWIKFGETTVTDMVTHWMRLPEPPALDATLPSLTPPDILEET